jgi:Fe-S cluster assembly protein SufB
MSTKGLTKRLVRDISKEKGEPAWMREYRMAGFSAYQKMDMPKWGPDLSKLNLKDISFYTPAPVGEVDTWEGMPEHVRSPFEKAGVAKEKDMGGSGAQFDSGVVYHHIKETLARQGVIFMNMDSAVREHGDLVREYFGSVVRPDEHVFTAAHYAATSGGTFVYVPKGVRVSLPLQAFFWMQSDAGGQFEHTLLIADEGSLVTYIEGCGSPTYKNAALHAGVVEVIVKKGASVEYISIENWAKNTYNLNTKRAHVEEGGSMKWLGGNMGAGVTMLYPTSVLKGAGARAHHVSVAVAGIGQVQDTGGRVIHVAPDTSSTIHARSVVKDGGVSDFRGRVEVQENASGALSSMICDSLMLDNESSAASYPAVVSRRSDVELSHEARIGSVGEEELFYAATRGISEKQAIRLIVGGFVQPILRSIPMEYALEFNRLLDEEFE